MALKELFATLGFQFDHEAVAHADNGITGLVHSVETLKHALLGGIFFEVTRELVEWAEGNERTAVRIESVFAEQADSVRAWADTFHNETGRAGDDLLDLAGEAGLIVTGLGAVGDQAAQLSTGIAALAVNMGAVFHRKDTEVLEALQTALTGSTRSLRQFGIVMSDASLQQFALNKGIRQKITDLNEAAILQLRYDYILDKGARFQGEAKNRIDELGNSMTNLKGELRDLGGEFGGPLLRFFGDVASKAHKLVLDFRELTKETHILQAVLAVLGGAVLLAGLERFGMQLFLVGVRAAKFTAAATLLAIVLDDIWNMLEGNKSVLGSLNEMLGSMSDGTLLEFSDAFQFLAYVIDTVGYSVAALAATFDKETREIAKSEVWEKIKEALTTAGDWWGQQIASFAEGTWDVIVKTFNAVKGFLKDVFTTAIESWSGLIDRFVNGVIKRVEEMALKIAHAFDVAIPDFIETSYNAGAGFLGDAAVAGKTAVQIGAEALGLGAPTVVNQPTTSVALNLTQNPGEDAEGFMSRIGTVVREIIDDQNDAAFEALVAGVSR